MPDQIPVPRADPDEPAMDADVRRRHGCALGRPSGAVQCDAEQADDKIYGAEKAGVVRYRQSACAWWQGITRMRAAFAGSAQARRVRRQLVEMLLVVRGKTP